MDQVISVVANVMTFLTPLLAIEWMIAYHRKSGGTWRDSTVGRLLMGFMGAIALVFVLNGVQLALILLNEQTPYWFFIVRVVTFMTLPVVIVWQRVLLQRLSKDGGGNRER